VTVVPVGRRVVEFGFVGRVRKTRSASTRAAIPSRTVPIRLHIAVLLVVAMASSGCSGDESAIAELGSLLAGGDAEVRAELELFDRDIGAYAERYGDELWRNRGIEADSLGGSAEGRSVAVVEALERVGAMVYVDWKTEAVLVLEQLNQRSGSRLERVDGYRELAQRYEADVIGIATVIDEDALERQALVTLIRQAGFELEALDEGSDAYPLVLIPSDDLDEVRMRADAADVGFYFARLFPDG